MTHAPLLTLDANAIAILPAAAVEPTAIALATEIDRLEALLAQIQRRLAQIPIHPQTDKEAFHALS
jgi:hypothetical protein